MRIISFLLLALISIGMRAQTEHQIVSASNSNEDMFYYYYDSQNRLVQQISNTTRYDYTYNEAGQCVKKQTLMWVSATAAYKLGNYEVYEYNTDGTVSKTTVMKRPYNSTEYAEDDVFMNYTYEDGFQKTWDNYYKGTLYYKYRNQITKNAAGEIVTVVTEQYDPDEPSKGWTTKTKMNYVWADISADYVPASLNYSNDNGKITLTWNAVSGAQSYWVTCDQTRTEVKGGSTSLTTTLGTGIHRVAVQAVIDGKARNAAFVDIDVNDPGKLPVENLTAGKCFITIEETESAEAPTREFYNIPLSWTIPAGHSEIKSFRVYYDSRTFGNATYKPVESPTATSYTLKVDPYELRDVDAEGNLTTGITTSIYVTVVYDSGESAKSNVISVNAYNEVVSGIEHVTKDENRQNSKIYNTAGQSVVNAKGIVIKNGKKMLVK